MSTLNDTFPPSLNVFRNKCFRILLENQNVQCKKCVFKIDHGNKLNLLLSTLYELIFFKNNLKGQNEH